MKRNVVGRPTFAALISVILVSLVSHAAWANDPGSKVDPALLAGDGQFVGEFKVVKVFTRDDDKLSANLCDVHHLPEGRSRPDSNCGKRVWAFEGKNQIALVTPPCEDCYNPSLMAFAIEGDGCADGVSVSDALEKGIFDLNLCTLSKQGVDGAGSSSYQPSVQSKGRAMEATGMLFVGGRSSTIVVVSDKEIKVREKVEARVLGIHVTLDKASVLLPVSR